MSFKFRFARKLLVTGIQQAVELNQAFIGAQLLAGWIAKDLYQKEDVEEWVERQEHYLYVALGILEGIKFTAPYLYNAYYHYIKAQAIFTCVLKRYWKVKTFIHVEATQKTEEKSNIGECTLLEAPECTKLPDCLNMEEFYNR